MVTKIKITKHLDKCSDAEDGEKLFNIIKPEFDKGEKVMVSFENIGGISESFVSKAFIPLLDDYDFEYIKKNLQFTNTGKANNKLIKKSFNMANDIKTNSN